MIAFTVSAVAGAVFAAFTVVAWLPAWDRDPVAAGRRSRFTNARNIRRALRPRHVRVPFTELLGGTP